MALNNHRPNRRTGHIPLSQGCRTQRRRTGERGPRFVIQHHEARQDYYDFRLEIGGTLVSWAIPRGAEINLHERRMARRKADCPLGDADAAGDGQVVVWDCGTYANTTGHEMATCLGRGHLSFLLNGDKLNGGYALTRIRDGAQETWLMVKRRDDVADEMNRLDR